MVATSLPTFYCEELEYAFGPTPMYSVSKALLNRGTRILQDKLEATRAAKQAIVLAVCPGNFESAMSTSEEILNGPISTQDAVESIFGLIHSHSLVQDFREKSRTNTDRSISEGVHGGFFYRKGEVISF